MGQRAQPLSCVKFVTRDRPDITSGRKEGQTSSQHDPYVLGYTHVTMDRNNGPCQLAKVSKSQKSVLSGDWGLQLDPMNTELVVIAGQSYRGEYVLASCTHRPSSQQSRKNLNPPFLEGRIFSAMGVKS